MDTEILQLEVQIQKVQTLLDKGLKVDVITQELGPGDSAKLFGLKGKAGWMIFKATKIATEEVANLPDETKEFKTDKTPGQRLRAVIYRLWEQTSRKETFDEFYKRHLEKLIDQYKDKLES